MPIAGARNGARFSELHCIANGRLQRLLTPARVGASLK